MFWNNSPSQTALEPSNKFKFIAQFNTFNVSNTNPLNVYKGVELGKIHLAVKKINLPNINFEFERTYANEYVHYFQNGSIHWEPITISFIDARSAQGRNADFTDISSFFELYINTYMLNFRNQQGAARNFETLNRTGLVDLPALCNNITITSFNRFANNDYPKGNDIFAKQIDSTPNNNTGSLEQNFVKNSDFRKNDFVIHRPRITKVDFGSMDYSSDEINEITITVVPEWCEIKY